MITRTRKQLPAVFLALCLLPAATRAAEEGKSDSWIDPVVIEYTDGLNLRLGMDIRARMTTFDREAIWPSADTRPQNGPGLEYLRVRTRIWGSLDLTETSTLNLRLVNRVHSVSSHFLGDPMFGPGTSNNFDAATWEWPDEVIFDNLNLEIKEILDSPFSATIGRQSMILGNGMIFLEGTPYDQGRTIYFDGLTVRYGTETDKLTLFAFWDDYKDEFWVIRDQDRRLRRGDTFTTGAYWTHNFSENIHTDLYYNFTEIEDDYYTTAERNHFADENAIIHTYGTRVFGAATELIDYSAELAFQGGQATRRTDEKAMTGMMTDIRVNFKTPEDTTFDPSLLLEYTYFSGDDPDSPEEFEGWHPLFAEYPIFREELLPILNNGNWSNLHQYRIEGKLALTQKLTFTTAYAYLLADTDAMTGGTGGAGAHFGELLSAFLDYSVNKNLSFALESAFFFPGNYWKSGDESKWLRFQTMFKF